MKKLRAKRNWAEKLEQVAKFRKMRNLFFFFFIIYIYIYILLKDEIAHSGGKHYCCANFRILRKFAIACENFRFAKIS